MWSAWLWYLLLLAAAALFYVLFTGWLGGYLLALVLLLPAASLAVSLPAALSLRFRLSILPGDDGEDGHFLLRLEVQNKLRLPVRRLAFRLQVENLFSGQKGERRRQAALGCGDWRDGVPFAMKDCGVAQGRLRFLRAYDCLGLFPIPLKGPAPARELAWPRPVPPPAGLEELTAGWEEIEAARGGGPEEYSLRDYQPGDPLRSVHWKISSKLDRLTVRQPEGGERPEPILLFELWGPIQRLNRLLDQLDACCQSLWDRGIACRLVWAGGSEGRQIFEYRAAGPADWQAFLWQVCAQPASPKGVEAALLAAEEGWILEQERTLYLDGLEPKEDGA